jgi:hypothetical protein
MTGRTPFSETTKKHIRKGATNSSWCWNYQSIHIFCYCTKEYKNHIQINSILIFPCSMLQGFSLFNHSSFYLFIFFDK